MTLFFDESVGTGVPQALRLVGYSDVVYPAPALRATPSRYNANRGRSLVARSWQANLAGSHRGYENPAE